ncbi:hypothetical protein LPJ61_000172 [Coemansia biformis]|uniref:RNA helicase n=1 Tax=Coemansia biformis TaxID=1286918 RepID=A0A9W8CZA1_9FUNG|nr:hypothetical protein LPJ61_000172 [Coemansia biformis]
MQAPDIAAKRRKGLADALDRDAGTVEGTGGFVQRYYGGASLGGSARRASIDEQRRRLPAFKHRLQLLYAIETHLTTIVTGEPGSGKSTQLPQYLYEAGWAADGKAIACTQPRRVAAAMLAQRVADEMGVELGTTVGFSVRFSDASDPQATRIKYLTDGTLVRECYADPLLSAYSVIMVDEAQDRTIATDTLLALLKKVQRKRRGDLRVVISSATLDAERLRAFFGRDDTATVSISGQLFPVDTQYLDAPCENYVTAAVETVLRIHELEALGDILVFLPGKDDIAAAISQIEDLAYANERLASLLPLPMHAGLSVDGQRVALEPASAGVRKAIFATNVAETSVTIDGVLYVVDCGFVKQRLLDPATGLDRLATIPISKSSARQRAGRAGRTQPGKVFRLYTHAASGSSLFPQHDVPEVCRLPLAPMALTLKALGVDNLARFDYVQPPPPALLSHALEALASLGAIDAQTGSLTQGFGLHLVELPLDPPLGACLLNSVRRFGCVREALAAVALLSLGETPFVAPSGRQAEAREDWRDFMAREGDVLTRVNALLGYQDTPARARQQWCRTHFLSSRLLDQATRVSRQLEGYLVRFGHSRSELASSCGRDASLLQKCLVSGLFANAARRDGAAGGSGYRLLRGGAAADIHPSSVYFAEDARPEYVIFASAMATTKTYIQGVTAIEPEWLTELAPHYFSASQAAPSRPHPTN